MTQQGQDQNEAVICPKVLYKTLNEGEFRTVCFDLGVNYDDLEGDQISTRMISMLSQLVNHGRLPDLQNYIFESAEFGYVKNAFLAEKLDLKRRDIEGVNTAESPYRGLQAFHEEHQHIYFGRAALTSELEQRFRFILAQPEQANFLAILGASGSGKSSLAQAGMIPALRPQNWPIYIMTPTADPLQSMARTFMQETARKTAVFNMQADLAEDERSLAEYIPDILARHSATESPSHLLLVIDQFEELFTLCRDEDKRAQFVNNLLYALDPTQNSKLAVLLTLRADFYHRIAWSDGLRELLQNQQAYIGRMTRAELQQTIEGPAHLYEYTLEEGLIKRILDDVGNEPGNLPLLSHALQETWQQREGEDGRALTLAGYEKSGGVKGAIARTADAELAKLTPTEQAIVRNIFTRLTELGEGSEDTRRRVRLAELIPHGSDSETVLNILAQLASARLVTTGGETVDVSHEALIREWDTLRDWLDEDRDGLRLRDQLNKAATFWDDHNRQPHDLYSGTRLSQALEWQTESTPQLSQLETLFLRTSQEEKERQEKEEKERQERELANQQALTAEQTKRAEEAEQSSRQLRQRRNIAFGLAGLAGILAVVALIYFLQASRIAQTAQAQAVISLSTALLPENPTVTEIELARLLGQGVKLNQELQEQWFSQTVDRNFMHKQMIDIASLRDTQRQGHTDWVLSVAFAPDGQTLASASFQELRLWDMANPSAPPPFWKVILIGSCQWPLRRTGKRSPPPVMTSSPKII